jgi:hypothetical protein
MFTADAPPITDEVVREAQSFQIAAKASRSPIQTKHDSETQELSQLGLLQRAVSEIEENKRKAFDLHRQLERAQAVVKVVEGHRKKFVDGILEGISRDVGDLCEKIHPGEGIKIRSFLNPKTRASLELVGEFEGVPDVPPQAYYSESHLDTLGVCIFLALAKRSEGQDSVVVLDDVVTSVDGPHTARFLDMLVDESEHFSQLVIATHYRPWLEHFRHARGPGAKVKRVRLERWSLARGIRPGDDKLAVQQLRDEAAARPFDRQVVASKAGIILESLLDQLALHYQCKVARKPEPIYTLQELLDCFDKRLRRALQCSCYTDGKLVKETAIGPLLDAVAGHTWIRNQVGCHWSSAGFDASEADVLEFAEKTVALADAVICPKCGMLPLKNKTGSYWQCGCADGEGLRLSPLENLDG